MRRSDFQTEPRTAPMSRSGRPSPGLRLCLGYLAFGVAVATAAHDVPLNPEDPAYLRRQYAWFQAQDARRQQQLRKLHSDFMQLEPETQARLTRVMQKYNLWVAGLSAADRERVLSAPTSAARLDLIRSMREAEWVATLPKPYRDEYARLDEEGRRQKVRGWREEESDRREEWALAQRYWTDHPGGKVPAMFLDQARPQVDAFAGHLRENLNEAEKKELDDAKTAADEGNYFWYALEVVRLADRHPILPGSVGPKDFDALPESVRTYLTTHDPEHFQPTKGLVRSGADAKLLRAQGRWPEFAIELTAYCQKHNLQLPVPLGDCRKDQMPPEVRQGLENLERQLRRTETGKAKLNALNKAQGTWPDYPRMIVELARESKVQLSGWMLPGPSREWAQFRAKRIKAK